MTTAFFGSAAAPTQMNVICYNAIIICVKSLIDSRIAVI